MMMPKRWSPITAAIRIRTTLLVVLLLFAAAALPAETLPAGTLPAAAGIAAEEIDSEGLAAEGITSEGLAAEGQEASESPAESVERIDLARLAAHGGSYTCRYEEHYYDGVGESVLTVEKIAEGYRAEWQGITDTSEIFLDEDLRTQKLIFTDDDTDLMVERRGDRLFVSGTDECEAVDELLNLDSDRWFQLLPVSLMPFTLSDDDRAEFSLFDPYNIKVRNLKVEKKDTEQISVNGREFDALKLNIRLRGFMTLFWKSEVWNDASSGTYVQYEGLNVVPEMYTSKIFLKSINYRPE